MLTIGQVAAKSGLRASAIRYYEAQGLLPTARREGGKRVYDDSVMDRLALIELAKSAGFDLAEIAALIAGAGNATPASLWKRAGDAKSGELDDQLSTVVTKMMVLQGLLECRCKTLDDCARAFEALRADPRVQALLRA